MTTFHLIERNSGLFGLTESARDMNPTKAAPAKKPQDQVHDALKTAVMSVLDDQKLDVGGKILKIKAILKAREDAVLALAGDTPSRPAPKKSVREQQDNGLDNGLHDDDVQESDRSGIGLESFFDEMRGGSGVDTQALFECCESGAPTFTHAQESAECATLNRDLRKLRRGSGVRHKSADQWESFRD